MSAISTSFQRYLGFQHQTSNKPSPNVGASKNKKTSVIDKQMIISTIPKNLKRKSELLLQFLESEQARNRITWDTRGEVTIDGEKVESSNIIDLVNDIVRPRKNSQAVE